MVGETTLLLVAISGQTYLKILSAKQMKFCVWFEMVANSGHTYSEICERKTNEVLCLVCDGGGDNFVACGLFGAYISEIFRRKK